MGYSTDFRGTIELDRQLSAEDRSFLEKLASTRRMARNVKGFGVEGEFYVDGSGPYGQNKEDNVIDSNRPPRTQPSLWCQWVPTFNGWGLEWDGSEKFYNYVEWMEYIINKILAPRGYVANGRIEWRGEEWDDTGVIVVTDNIVTTEDK